MCPIFIVVVSIPTAITAEKPLCIGNCCNDATEAVSASTAEEILLFMSYRSVPSHNITRATLVLRPGHLSFHARFHSRMEEVKTLPADILPRRETGRIIEPRTGGRRVLEQVPMSIVPVQQLPSPNHYNRRHAIDSTPRAVLAEHFCSDPSHHQPSRLREKRGDGGK